MSKSSDDKLNTVSQVENLAFYNFSLPFTEEDKLLPISRRNSHGSLDSSSTRTTTSLNQYDSGHFSSSNASVCPLFLPLAQDDSTVVSTSTFDDRFQDVLRERDASLQEVRKLRSELERLSKSEKWYKNELDSKKRSQRQVIEKFHASEKNYIDENHKLQRKCVNLYKRCLDLEKAFEDNTNEIVKQSISEPVHVANFEFDSHFEITQQNAIISDQQKLIEALRKQRHSLIDELRSVTLEKDQIVLNLDKQLSQQQENIVNITARYDNLLRVNNDLEKQIESNFLLHNSMKSELSELQQTAKGLELNLEIQLNAFNEKQLEIAELQMHLNEARKHSSELQNINSKQRSELDERISENILLQNKIDALQAKTVLRHHVESQQIKINQLQSRMHEHETNEDVLKSINDAKTKQIEECKQEIELHRKINKEMKDKQASYQESTQLSQTKVSRELERAKNEVESLSEKYSKMCSICEQIRFELDMREIALEKLRFERKSDWKEIEELRQKLSQYSINCDIKKNQITKLEYQIILKNKEIDEIKESKRKVEIDFETMQENFTKNLSENELGTKELKDEISSLKINILKKDDELESIEKEKLACEKELDELSLKLNEFNAESEKQKAQIISLGEELSMARKEFITVDTERTMCHKNIKELQMRLSSISTDEVDKCLPSKGEGNDFKAVNENDNEKQLKSQEVQKLKAQIIDDDKLKTFSTAEKDLAELQAKYSKLLELLRVEFIFKVDSCSHENRIGKIRKLIAQQSAKVEQITTNEEEWQLLLNVLNDSQNTQSHNLTTYDLDESMNLDFLVPQTDDMKRTFHIEYDSMKKCLKANELKLISNQQEINRLNERNERLIEEFSDDFSRQRESSKKENRLLSSQIATLTDENENLQRELRNLKSQIKSEDNSSQKAIQQSSTHLRIYTNALKSEYHRKLTRYDQHIRSLLMNVKNLKRALALAEDRNVNLIKDKSKMCANNQMLEGKFNKLQQKFELNQITVQELEQKLDSMKRSSCPSNLIDDYKKLMKQSSVNTQRPTNNAIYDLIKRSNNCAPTLKNLSNVVDDLRGDIELVLESYLAGKMSVSQTPMRQMSLMDELKAAGNQ